MLRKLSKSGIYLQTIFIFIFLGVYMITPLPGFTIQTMPGNAAPLGRLITQNLPENRFAVKFIAVLLILLNITVFNFILRRHDLHQRQSVFTAALASGFYLFTGTPAAMIAPLVAVLMLQFSFDSAMKIYGVTNPYDTILNSSITIGLASMIQPLAVLFLIFLWMAFFTLRISTWREWVISLLGLLIPYIYLAFWFFWTDRLDLAIAEYADFFRYLSLIPVGHSVRETGILALLGLILIISMAAFVNDAGDKIISIRKKMWIGVQFTLISIAAMVLSGKDAMLTMPLVLLPVSMMFAHLVTRSKRSWPWDLLYGIFLAAIIAIRMGV